MRPLKQHGQLLEELINIPRCVSKNNNQWRMLSISMWGDEHSKIGVVILYGTLWIPLYHGITVPWCYSAVLSR